jgi:hypothetical protein
MSKFSLGPIASDWFIAFYLTATLAIRFILEPQLNGYYLISLGLGAFALLFLWALIKSKILRPSYFGFFPQKVEDQNKSA